MRRLLPFAFCFALVALPASALAARSGGPPVSLSDLRAHVKHVFVVYQENRSFDSYFGTYPGAENLASARARAHGFTQRDPIGNQMITPYRIADPDLSDVDHSRPALLARVNGGAMNQYLIDEETRKLKAGSTSTNAQRLGLLTMSHNDCDTVPFLWKYASTFALYDHIFQGMAAPSTPGNIELVSAQTGLTQAARHPDQRVAPTDDGPGVPVVNDTYPAFGPYHNGEPKAKQDDLTFANLLLTLSGTGAAQAQTDSDDIKDDVAALVKSGKPQVGWGWYQEGFTDDGSGLYPAYVAHLQSHRNTSDTCAKTRRCGVTCTI